MPKWEYRYVVFDLLGRKQTSVFDSHLPEGTTQMATAGRAKTNRYFVLVDYFEKLGSDGWEMINWRFDRESEFWFKRPLAE
ncbi:MAG: hypothetical protein ACXADH_11740 [Candidatus Kariarchaeaceae archaeon]|jgi:hypothetical protein